MRSQASVSSGASDQRQAPSASTPTSPGRLMTQMLGAFAEFEHAHIYWRNGAQAAYAIPHGGLFEEFARRGFERGIGFPLLRHDVRSWGGVQSFEKGVLFVPSGGTPSLVHGEIGKKYAAMGWETGALGLPTSDEQKVAGTDNIVQFFEHGDLRWSPTGVIVNINGKA